VSEIFLPNIIKIC